MRLEGKDVRSLKKKWKGNEKGIHEGCGQSYGNGKIIRNLAMEFFACVTRQKKM